MSFDNLKLPYSFKNADLLSRALTHSSFLNESSDSGVSSYERLEFLGDAVLELIISEILFTRFKSLSEGELTRLRAAIVCEPSLASIAKDLNVGVHIRFSKGEAKTGGKNRTSILADVVESIIAAIYLDGGLLKASDFVKSVFENNIEKAIQGKLIQDYKSELQVWAQKNGKVLPKYILEKCTGPDHSKTFVSSVYLGKKKLGLGEGKTKRDSQQEAARIAYYANCLNT